MRTIPTVLLTSKNLLADSAIYRRLIQTSASPVCQKWSLLYGSNNYTLDCHDNFMDKSSLQKHTQNLNTKLVDPLIQISNLSSADKTIHKSRSRLFFLPCYQTIQSLPRSIESFLYHFSGRKDAAAEKINKNRDNELSNEDRNKKDEDEDEDEDDDEDEESFPSLMDFPNIDPFPTIRRALKNTILTYFYIKPVLDPNFFIEEFYEGAKQALLYISDRLSKGDVDSLEGCVDSEALDEIRKNITKFTPAQLAFLKVEEKDILFFVCNDINIIFKDEGKRFVEITMVYHIGKGTEGELKAEELSIVPIPVMSQCIYRFIREYTKGVEGEWICNRLNHFKLDDLTKKMKSFFKNMDERKK